MKIKKIKYTNPVNKVKAIHRDPIFFFNKTKYLKETYSGIHPDSYKKSSIIHLSKKQTN